MRDEKNPKILQLLYDREIEVQESDDLLAELASQKRLILDEVDAYVAHASKRRAGPRDPDRHPD